MKEFLLYHQEKWWHFFIKPPLGLCYRTKENGRFTPLTVLLPEACADFCAIIAGGRIHMVCQNRMGSILYLVSDGENLEKTVLLESKEAAPYPKHFHLLAIGDFINLFYVITYKERQMLIHHIITGENRPPTVVDRIAPAHPVFSVMPYTGTDILLLYENEAGKSGTKLYRWSQKRFEPFVPVNPQVSCKTTAFLPESSGKIHYAALDAASLIYFVKNTDKTYTPAVPLSSACPPDACPVFCASDGKLSLLWQENGGIMSAHSDDEGQHWSKPIRYIVPADANITCYGICQGEALEYTYGHTKEQDIILYGTSLTPPAPVKDTPTLRPEGYEAASFAKACGGLPEQEPLLPPQPIIDQLKNEIFSLKEQLFYMRKMLAQITEDLKKHPSALPLAQDETLIDDILLQDFSEKNRLEHPDCKNTLDNV